MPCLSTAPNNTKLKDIHQEIESTWKNIANFLSGSTLSVSSFFLVVIGKLCIHKQMLKSGFYTTTKLFKISLAKHAGHRETKGGPNC